MPHKPMFNFIDDGDATDDALIERLQDQLRAGIQRLAPDSPAARDWERFYKLYAGIIRRMAKRCGVDRAEIEDVVSEVMLRVLQGLDTFRNDGRGGSLRRWLYTIVRCRTTDVLRRKNRHPTGSLTVLCEQGAEPLDPGPDPADAFDACWRRELLTAVLDIFA